MSECDQDGAAVQVRRVMVWACDARWVWCKRSRGEQTADCTPCRGLLVRLLSRPITSSCVARSRARDHILENNKIYFRGKEEAEEQGLVA